MGNTFSSADVHLRPWFTLIAGELAEFIEQKLKQPNHYQVEAKLQLLKDFPRLGKKPEVQAQLCRCLSECSGEDFLQRLIEQLTTAAYFNSRYRLPPPKAGGPLITSNRKRGQALLQFIASQTATIHQAVTAIAIAYTVIRSLPNSGINVEQFKQQLQQHIEATTDVTVTAIELELAELPTAGEQWLSKQAKQQVPAAIKQVKALKAPLVCMISDWLQPIATHNLAIVQQITVANEQVEAISGYHTAMQQSANWLSEQWQPWRLRRQDDQAPLSYSVCLLPELDQPPLFGLRRLTQHLWPYQMIWRLRRALFRKKR
ncbi:hypothetical protein [Halioxenophilus sp. WMMB6]|uniref:hypothetical protein n=1 Tax=Halioxenophilus sp. WMMB6 TaxID=3073815 RepID=UPI00295EAE5A|nr:hypothetical protein [Halioxenophilus sp. WMMB6]